MKLAAIIINYRTADLTARVTTALLPQLDAIGDCHVYIVDNLSGDGSVERLRAHAQTDGWGARVTVVDAPRNGGYGYGINVAIALARATPSPPPYYFVLNSDAFADPGAVQTMLDFMERHPDAGLCGADIHGTDGSKQGSAFRFPTAASEFIDTARTAVVEKLLAPLVGDARVAIPLPAEPTEAEWISGTCMMLRREVVDRVGWFDEGFFLYFEEVDYCRRARRAGWRSYCVPAAQVTHLGSVSTGVGDPSRPMPSYWFDSRHRYLEKHHGRRYALLCDVCWLAGFAVVETKQAVLRRPPTNPPHMLRDFVRSSLQLLVKPKGPDANDAIGASPGPATGGPATGGPTADARRPSEMGALELLAEDFATYDHSPFQPGLWAVATHRLGLRAAAINALPVRLATQTACRLMSTGVDWVWGINIPQSVDLGRRVRIWHNGCVLLTARSIGNDVQIRHDTTFGPLRGAPEGPDTLPVIEDRADIGSGVCVLGAVRVGHDAVVGANSVVLKNVAPHATVLGVPARTVPT